MIDVLAHQPARIPDRTDVGARRPSPRLPELLLDRRLNKVVELLAAARKELDAVVGHGVVGGGNHDAEVGLDGAHQVGHGWGGEDASVEHVDAGAREARGHRGREELAGHASIAAEDGRGAMARELASLAQYSRGCHGEPDGQLGRHIPIRDSTHTVGTEQARHARNAIAWSTAGRDAPS